MDRKIFYRSCRAWAGTATETPAPLNAARRRMIRIGGRSLGNGTAFSAVAPSQRPVGDAHQSKIFESGISMMSPGPEYLNTLVINLNTAKALGLTVPESII